MYGKGTNLYDQAKALARVLQRQLSNEIFSAKRSLPAARQPI
jgi:hypothetical protein